VYSQGICFKISEVLPPGFYDEGEDVTDIIGVKKIEEYPEEQQGQAERKNNPIKNFLFKHKATRWLGKKIFTNSKPKEKFPSFIAKTDEERVQNLPKIIADTDLWQATEKLDGTSATYYATKKKHFFYDKYTYHVCSRNLVVDDQSSFYWQVFNNSKIDKLLRMIMDYKDVPWACLQGEIIGPGIQGNKYGRKDYELYVFNLIVPDKTYPWNPQFNRRFSTTEAECFAKSYGIKWVPTVTDIMYLPDSIDEIVAMADGKSVLCDRNREGLVFRTLDGKRSFKAVSNKFLIELNKSEDKKEAKKVKTKEAA